MSHYPTTAELAAFRRDIARVKKARDGYVLPPPPDGGAYRIERREGIGFLESDPSMYACCIVRGDSHTGAVARREAGAMRTRAYEASRCPVCSYANLPDSEGCVCYTGDPWLSCDICDGREWSGDLTPDWNGETGCHLSCEPAYV